MSDRHTTRVRGTDGAADDPMPGPDARNAGPPRPDADAGRPDRGARPPGPGSARPDRRAARRERRRRRARGWKVLFAALRRRPGALLLLAVWSAVEAAPVLVFGRAVAGATDAFLGHRPDRGLLWLAALALAALAGAVGSARAYRPLAQVVEPLRDALVRHVVRAAVRDAVRTGRPGDAAVARLTQHVEIVRDTFAGLLVIVRGFVFTLAGALIGLSSLMPVTLLLVVPPVAAGLGLFLGLVSRAMTRQRELILAEERVAESTTALAAGLRDITACGAEEAMAAEAGRLVDAQAATARAVARLAAGRTVALAVGGRLPLLAILAAAPWLLRHGATAGTVLGALTYVLQGLTPALHTVIRGMGGSGLRLAVTLDRVMEAAAAPDPAPVGPRPAAAGPDGGRPETRRMSGTPGTTEADGPPGARAPAIGEAAGDGSPAGEPDRTAGGEGPAGGRGTTRAVAVPRGRAPADAERAGGEPAGAEVRLSGVTFAYGPRAVPVIDDLSLTVPDGDHLAVVGPSGIGKSTLASLIAGLRAPSRGTVRVGGVDAVRADPSVRVLIPQEAYVFSGTLRDNLCYLRPCASDALLDAATAAVGLTETAARLGGYGAPLDPAALSAGERQLIALTRAYLSPARLVILDEATCHLDAVAEERAERAFAARPGSLIVIAHRMTSARRARRILVLDGARAWAGTHTELLPVCALYRELHGHWAAPATPGRPGSQPARVVGDADGVDAVARAHLSDDPRHVVAHRADRQEEVARDVGR